MPVNCFEFNPPRFSFSIDGKKYTDDELNSFFKDIASLPFTEPNCSAEEEFDCVEPADDNGSPIVETVIFNGPATTIIWADGDKTTVKCSDDQPYDRYAGFCAAITKRFFGSTSAAKRFLDDHDMNLQRQLRAEKLEAEKKKRQEEEIAARAKKAMNVVPSFPDLQRQAYRRAIEKCVEEMADDIVNNVRARVKAREVADMLKNREDKKED